MDCTVHGVAELDRTERLSLLTGCLGSASSRDRDPSGTERLHLPSPSQTTHW